MPQRRQFLSLVPRLLAATAAPALIGLARAQEGVSGHSVVIGSSAALSGPLAALGQDLKLGIDAAMGQINARGGVQGRSLQLQMVDDAYQPNRTLDNVRKMAGEGGVLALLSCVGTPNNTAILPVIEENGLPYVAPLTGASSLRKAGSRNLFHVRASYTDETQRLIQRLGSMGLNGLAIVYMDNGFGREVLGDALKAMEGQGMKAVAQVALDTGGKNLAEVVTQVLAAKPSAVFMATAGAVSQALVTGLRKPSPSMPVVGLSVALSNEGVKAWTAPARTSTGPVCARRWPACAGWIWGALWSTLAMHPMWARTMSSWGCWGLRAASWVEPPLPREGASGLGSAGLDHGTGHARAGIAGGLGGVVVGVAVHDQAFADDALRAGHQGDAPAFEVHPGHALGVGLEHGQVTHMVGAGVMPTMGAAAGVEVTAGAHAVAAAAVAFFVHMKAMFCIRLEAADLAAHAHHIAALAEAQTAADAVAPRGLQIGHGPRAWRGAGAAGQGQGHQGAAAAQAGKTGTCCRGHESPPGVWRTEGSAICAPEGAGRALEQVLSPGRAGRGEPSSGRTPVEQGVQPDGAEGGGADAAQAKVAEFQREVAGAQDQGHGRHDQVLVV